MRNFIQKHWNGIMNFLIILCAIVLTIAVVFVVQHWEWFTDFSGAEWYYIKVIQ